MVKHGSTITDAAVRQAADWLRPHLPVAPQVGVILGSGLGSAGQQVVRQGAHSIPYHQIPHMPEPAVAGHDGQLVIGTGAHAGTLMLQGRVHYYEGHSRAGITFATRLLAALGVHTLVVSNAAGGIAAAFAPGDLMLISGHWTFLDVQCPLSNGTLLADSPPSGTPRGCPLTGLWDADLLRLAKSVPTSLQMHAGVYAMMSGPNYETPAEIRMLQTLGVDAVGMSTVPEAMAAVRHGLRVLGVSCITNVASGLSDQPLNHADVEETAAHVETAFCAWLFRLLPQLHSQKKSPAIT